MTRKTAKVVSEAEETNSKPVARSHGRSLISDIFGKGKRDSKKKNNRGSGKTVKLESEDDQPMSAQSEEFSETNEDDGSESVSNGSAHTDNKETADQRSSAMNQMSPSSATSEQSVQLDTAVARSVSGSGSGGPQRSTASTKPATPKEDDEIENEINELMSDVRSESPALPGQSKSSKQVLDEEGRQIEVVPCTICGRKFAVDRIQTHASVCAKVKERKPYDIAMMRVAGTEAEELIKAGKMKLEPAKPIPKKSVLHQKMVDLGGGLTQTAPLPPIATKSKTNETIPEEKTESAKPTSYQLLFDDNDGYKTKKTSKFSGFPSTGMNQQRLPTKKIDTRFLSAEKTTKRSTNSSSTGTDYTVDSEDDDYDYLAASMTSQKTVCSDAFDFLFDSQNLNPDTIQAKLERQNSTWTGEGDGKRKTKSSVCAIS